MTCVESVFTTLLLLSLHCFFQWKWKWKLRPHGLYSPWNSSGQNTGVDSLSLLQGIFPTQVSYIMGGFFTSWATRIFLDIYFIMKNNGLRLSSFWGFLGDPVVRTPHFIVEGQGSIPGQGTTMPHSTVKKKKLSSYYVSSTILSPFQNILYLILTPPYQ